MYPILVVNFSTDITVVVICNTINQVIETCLLTQNLSQITKIESVSDLHVHQVVSFEQYKQSCEHYYNSELCKFVTTL